MKRISLCIVLLLLAGATTGRAQPVPGVLPLLGTAPRIDGKIEAGEWQNARALRAFKTVNPQADFPLTQAWVAGDDDHLYLAVRCVEPLPGKIKAAVVPDQKDGDVAADDCVQLFVDLENTGQSIFQFIASSRGAVYDASIQNGVISPAAWESGAKVGTHVGAAEWTAEIALPLQTMGHQWTRGEVIALNVGRNRNAGGKLQSASLAGGRYLVPEQFPRLLVGGAAQANGLSLISPRRGPFFRNTAGAWTFEIIADKAAPDALQIAFPNTTEPPRTYALKEGVQEITVPIPADQVAARSRIAVSTRGQTLYAADYEVAQTLAPARVEITKNPLFRELLEPRPNGLSKDGILMWAHDLIGPPRPSDLAHRTGTVYSREAVYRALGRDRSILIATTGSDYYAPETKALMDKYGVKLLLTLSSRAALEAGAPTGGKRAWLVDPRAEEALLQDARKAIALAKEHPQVWGIFMGDESWESNDATLKWLLDNKRDDYPLLQTADAEIKAKYGFGKYGLPESSTDPNPYRWIATRRWEADKMLETARRIKALIQAEAPQLKLVSWDNRAGHQPYHLRRWGEIFDVVTGQLYPRNDAARHSLGFMTRLFHDLTGSDEFWPVPHLEHYPGNYTAGETIEHLSQAFRNGATGLHIYPSDTIGRRAGKGSFATDRIGAPERWQAREEVFDLLKTPFAVRQPHADTAIFYSNSSYQAELGLGKDLGVEWIYTILGPQLHSAVSFIDDLLVREKPQQLSQYKTIYFPYAPFADDAEYSAFQRYVENGGTLIVNDPLAFRHRTDGTERAAGTLVPPLESVKPIKAPADATLQTTQGQTLKAARNRYVLQKSDATVLVRDANGAAMATENRVGKGKVLFFGVDNMALSVIKDSGWTEFYRTIQQQSGARLEQDVWRFRFPTPEIHLPSHPAGECLTGNYFEWRLSEARPLANANIGGTYRLSVAAAEPADKEIPFSEGRLTDRIRGAAAANDAPPKNYELSWKAEKPLEITFRFERAVQAQQTRLFYFGTLPAGWCEVSADGQNWQKVGEWKNARTDDPATVALQNLEWPAQAATQVRFHFAAAPGQTFTLVEADIWRSARG